MKKRENLYKIERSLIKIYRKDIWGRFIGSIQDYKLIDQGDRIAVGISGGKDSLIMAKLLQEFKKHDNQDFELEFIAMDPGYTQGVRKNLEDICDYLKIPVKIFDSNIFEIADEISTKSPCYLCARMRRGFLYHKAQELGCNKLALGHHFNDVIETTMMNILCSGNYKTMMPKLKADNFADMELIRPIYQVKEKDIEDWMDYTGLEALDCSCSIGKKESAGKRQEVKQLIEQLGENFKDVDISIFRSAENIDLGGIIGYKKDEKKYSFLDDY